MLFLIYCFSQVNILQYYIYNLKLSSKESFLIWVYRVNVVTLLVQPFVMNKNYAVYLP
jgi:hypothetical protein